MNPQPVLTKLFTFMLGQDISGTVLEQRINQVCQTDSSAKATYKLKSTSNNLSRNRGLYADEQINFLKESMPYTLYFFGYANVNPDSETSFFEFTTHAEQNK